MPQFKPRTIIEKIWDSHVVTEAEGAPSLLYIDFHLVHEVTSPQAFAGLREKGRGVRRPQNTFATVDHSTPTTPRDLPILDPIESVVSVDEADTAPAKPTLKGGPRDHHGPHQSLFERA